jgi:hypothetical protein
MYPEESGQLECAMSRRFRSQDSKEYIASHGLLNAPMISRRKS